MKITERLSDFDNYPGGIRTGGLMSELVSPTLPTHHLNEIDKLINETIKLEVGDFVVLRDDLVSGREYDNCLYLSTMAYSFNKDKLIDEKIPCLRIKEYVNTLLKSRNPETINHFVVYDQPPFMRYSYEMLQWKKSIILNYLISKLNFCIEEAMCMLDRVYENYIYMVNSSTLNDKQYTSNEQVIKSLDVVAHINVDFENEITTNNNRVRINATYKYHDEFKKLVLEYDPDVKIIKEDGSTNCFETIEYISSDESFLEDIQNTVAKALFNTLLETDNKDTEEYKLPVAGEVNLLSQSKFNETLDKVFSNNVGVDELDSDTLDFMIQLDTSKLLRYANSKLDKVLGSIFD